MKKFYILLLSLVVVFITALYISSFKPKTNQFKAIYQSYGYVYNEDKRMEVEIYSEDKNSIIEKVDINDYFIEYQENKIVLNNVVINKIDFSKYCLYKIDFDIFEVFIDELIINDAILAIENNEFKMKINIGKISILKKEIQKLEYTDIYASYTYMNNSLMLVGINIKINGEYNRISNLKVNGLTYTDTNLIVFDKEFLNEINIKNEIPNYKYNSIVRSHRLIDSYTMFIPVTYKELIVIKGGYIVITLDGVEYVVDEFDYIFNDIHLPDYTNYIKESYNVKA